MTNPAAPTSPELRSGAWVEIDLGAIRSNVELLRNCAGTADVMAVVKADGYGHGIIESARAARAGGAAWLGVAFVSEALALRRAGDTEHMLAWLHPVGTDFDAAVTHDVDLSVGSAAQLDAVVNAATRLGVPARIHLKADTGLSRGGATGSQWPSLVAMAAEAQRAGLVDVVAVWSHLSHGDEPFDDAVDVQVAAFDEAWRVAVAAGFGGVRRHLANSGAVLARPDLAYDIVRPGLAVYGLTPSAQVGSPAEVGLRPAMTVHSTVAMVKSVAAGVGVSYSHRYTTSRDTRLALIPLGYADGLPRTASNRGPLLVGGQRVTVAGSVCMDQVVVDLGPESMVATGDPVVVVGTGMDGAATASEWAEVSDTIAWEILTRLGAGLPRHYRGVDGR